jgi:hypothetical protein
VNLYLVKVAADLQHHQERVVDKLGRDHPKLIAFHSLGSGKSLTALTAAKRALKDYPGKDVTIITPAALQKNMEGEAKKQNINLDRKRARILSYQKAVKDLEKLRSKPNSLIIVDEAHRLRNEESQQFKQLSPFLRSSDRLLLLSGSPLYNKAKDIATLVNSAAGKEILPQDEKQFDKAFVKKVKDNPGMWDRLVHGVKPGEHNELKNQKYLKRVMDKYVDYHNSQDSKSTSPLFPKTNNIKVEVPMSADQLRTYQYYEGRLPAALKWKIRSGVNPNKREAQQMNAFSSALRQISNTHHPFTKNFDGGSSPKINTAVSNLIKRVNADPNFRGVVYSNYLASGVNPYSKALEVAGIKHNKFTGEMSATEKAQAVKDYNSGKKPVLLLSSAGGEGIDLKGTKLVQILEPHFNRSKIDQVIGRGSRYKSHMHLPPAERKMEIEEYMSTIKPSMIDKVLGIHSKSIDQYLDHYSRDKTKVTDQIRDLAEQGTKA